MSFNLLISGHDNPRLRAELVDRLQPMLAPPASVAPPRWATAEVRDGTGGLIGGAIGLTAGLWLSVELLWMHRTRRGEGLGTALVRSIEEEACARGCVGACVETSSTAARFFYERVGYCTKLVREEAEPGLVRSTLQKRFRPSEPPR